MKRRHFLKNTILGAFSGLLAGSARANMTTPSEMEGPFYPITPQKDKDADLTRIAGKPGIAKGEIIDVFGQVFDTDLNPIEDVTIDLWQANSFGRYHHPHDDSSAPVDEHFQAWAILQSGSEGRFRFKTVIPGAYNVGRSKRPPHIHFKITKPGYESLLTQMYFPNHPLNAKDGLLRRKSAKEQAMMTAKKTSNTNEYRYDIVIEKVL